MNIKTLGEAEKALDVWGRALGENDRLSKSLRSELSRIKKQRREILDNMGPLIDFIASERNKAGAGE